METHVQPPQPTNTQPKGRATLLALAVGVLALLLLAARQPSPLPATSTYSLVKTYLNPSPADNEEFGNAVAWLPSGDNLIVGARGDNAVGAVYVLSATTGDISRLLTETVPSTDGYFGYSIAVSGTRVLVGAQLDDAGAVNAGSAFLYDAVTGDSDPL
jgi:hypothetical protein